MALLFSVTPGMSEVIEAAVHLVGHGDLPHHEVSDEEGDCSEHTCTPLAHHCGCHTTMVAQTASKVVYSNTAGDVTQSDPCAIAAVFGRACEPPPLRPPIC